MAYFSHRETVTGISCDGWDIHGIGGALAVSGLHTANDVGRKLQTSPILVIARE
jgi:hypothetical protein